MPVHLAREVITDTATSWEGVTAHPHRFGGVEYRLGHRELGHIHRDHLPNIPFTKRIHHDQVVADGMAKKHHLLPDTGWVSFYLRHPGDTDREIMLLERSYQLALTHLGKRRPYQAHSEHATS